MKWYGYDEVDAAETARGEHFFAHEASKLVGQACGTIIFDLVDDALGYIAFLE